MSNATNLTERPTIPVPGIDAKQAYRDAAKRNARTAPARGVPFQGCERPTLPVPPPARKVTK